MKQSDSKKMILAAMFLAIGQIMPFLTGQIPQIGQMLCPMHLPILLCGFICGWQYGGLVGLICPLLRSMIFGIPVMYPNALAMSIELAAYGFLSGFLWEHSQWQCVIAVYRCQILAMIGGRLVWGIVSSILYGLGGKSFGMQMFIAGAFINAIPGILLQLILIPALLAALNKAKLVTFRKNAITS